MPWVCQHSFFGLYFKLIISFVLSGILSVEVQEDMREAANNLVKHFHKPEQEVCPCNSKHVPEKQLSFI